MGNTFHGITATKPFRVWVICIYSVYFTLRIDTTSCIGAPLPLQSLPYNKGNLKNTEGVIVVSGMFIEGNTENAVLKGTLISYDNSETEIKGNIDLVFDRGNTPDTIAGFSGSGSSTLDYQVASYSEPHLCY